VPDLKILERWWVMVPMLMVLTAGTYGVQ
jgi:hypothetical protein